MRLRDFIIVLPCVFFALVLMYFASTRLDAIHSARDRMGLISNTPLENAPPSLAFATVAMGAFPSERAYDHFVQEFMGMLRDPDVFTYSILIIVEGTPPK